MVQNVRKKIGVIQNLGWLDRVVRFLIGAALVGVGCFFILVSSSIPNWAYYSILIAVYPALTGILGWDPFYEAFSVRSCGTSERNQCGTFPYEIDAALGNHPIPQSEIEHSLEHSRHPKPKNRAA